MKIKTAYDRMIDRAHTHLSPRATYGHDVLDGWQRWSGADLKGRAKNWMSYVAARTTAETALGKEGGETVYNRSQNGCKIAALPLAWTDDGSATAYQTADGYVVRISPGDMWDMAVRDATRVEFANGALVRFE